MSWDEFLHCTFGQVLTMLRMLEESEYRADLRAAYQCYIPAEINRDKERKPEPFHPFDFMLGWQKKPEKVLTEEQLVEMEVARIKKLFSPKKAIEVSISAENEAEARKKLEELGG
jgi:hypothetical protein